MSKKKQSLLIGALTSSFGIFISKLLGLFYVVPLNSLAGEGNMVFYSIAYTYYDLLLKVCGAGIPFAIAALVAKYYAREDYKTVLLVKKLGSSFLLVSSFIVAILFLMFSYPLSSMAMGAEASINDINYLNNLFKILAIALILVPFLSSIRGYYQGLKKMSEYATSQVIEQFVRVFSIILLGFICVQLLNLDNIYAIYMAMLAASLGAVFAIIYLRSSGKAEDKEINELASKQDKAARNKTDILKEMLSLGIPYLLISFLGTASSIVNSNFFMSYATSIGVDYDTAKLVLGILQVNCNKIAAIPQVLTLGFSAGLVPYLTESLESRDFKSLRKHILDILDTVLFILVPIVLWMVIYAKPIYYIMYGNSNLELGTVIFVVSSITTLTDTIAPILSSMCITLRQRKSTILILLASAIVKFVTFFPMIKYTGYNGMTYSTAICSLVAIFLNLYVLKRCYDVNYSRTFKRLSVVLLASLISCLPILFVSFFGFTYTNRLLCILILAVYGLASMLIYIFITNKCGLIKALLHKDPIEIVKTYIKKPR